MAYAALATVAQAERCTHLKEEQPSYRRRHLTLEDLPRHVFGMADMRRGQEDGRWTWQFRSTCVGAVLEG